MLATEPGDDIGECVGKIAILRLELVVRGIAALVVGNVDEMEVALPAFAVVLVIISESCTLHESVLVFVLGQVSASEAVKIRQHLIGLLKGAGRLVRENVVGDVRH